MKLEKIAKQFKKEMKAVTRIKKVAFSSSYETPEIAGCFGYDYDEKSWWDWDAVDEVQERFSEEYPEIEFSICADLVGPEVKYV